MRARSRRQTVRLALLLCLSAAAGGCGPDPRARWQEAQALWEGRDHATAHAAFLAVDPRSPEGHEARRRLAEADTLYRRAIGLLERGAPGVRDAFQEALAVGPMDPVLYLPLARASRGRGFTLRAAEFYRKYLALGPGAPAAQAAQMELAALDRDGPDLPEQLAAPTRTPTTRWARGSSVAAAALAALLGLPVLITLSRRRRHGRSLSALAAARPELHPAIAYQIGSLRHELLKHRVGAVGEALSSLERPAPPAVRAFLDGRLFGGEPLLRVWEAHLQAFHRALGIGWDLRRSDRSFREAQRHIRRIVSLRPAFTRGAPGVVARLREAQAGLLRFGAELAALARGLARTVVDTALLEEVLRSVRAEYTAGQVCLDELRVEPAPPDVAVEVYRVDLLLVLKNLLRNAIFAVGRQGPPRRVALDVHLGLLPTGEELVRLRVRDSSPEPLDAGAALGRPADRGLGLVAAALSLYQGGLEIEPAGGGYEKGVAVWFLRVLDGVDAAAAPAEAA